MMQCAENIEPAVRFNHQDSPATCQPVTDSTRQIFSKGKVIPFSENRYARYVLPINRHPELCRENPVKHVAETRGILDYRAFNDVNSRNGVLPRAENPAPL